MQNNPATSPLRLLGALAGDIIGSVHEYTQRKSKEFPLFQPSSFFTDDSVLTLAVADAILHNRDYAETIRAYGRRYPGSGYGGMFLRWLQTDMGPYNSFGNGSAMRVSPVGWAFDSVEEVLRQAEVCAAVTHNHPEGIKGAQAVALAIYLARTGSSKEVIQQEITSRFDYDLGRKLEDIRLTYGWSEICQTSVPESIIAFLEADDFEDAVRNAISLGGDADTMAAIAGSIAEAFFGGVPQPIVEEVQQRLPPELWGVVEGFSRRFQ
jgi:ADP-ribosylglycohydrolase